jgi:hypothetical protein
MDSSKAEDDEQQSDQVLNNNRSSRIPSPACSTCTFMNGADRAHIIPKYQGQTAAAFFRWRQARLKVGDQQWQCHTWVGVPSSAEHQPSHSLTSPCESVMCFCRSTVLLVSTLLCALQAAFKKQLTDLLADVSAEERSSKKLKQENKKAQSRQAAAVDISVIAFAALL